MECKIKGCRFFQHHITSRHHCGKCDLLGHGQVECGRPEIVPKSNSFSVLEPCTLENCIDPLTHTLHGHCCPFCRAKKEHCKNCPAITGDYAIETDISTYFLEDDIVDSNLSSGKYAHKYGGMGSSIFIRCNKETLKLECFFMHSDSWGQYGSDTSDIPKLNAFICGYECV